MSSLKLCLMTQPGVPLAGSVVANPLDLAAGELLDLVSNLRNERVSVVAVGVPLKPDLPASFLAHEDHLAVAEDEAQITRTIHFHAAVATRFQNFEQSALRDGWPAVRANISD